MPSIVAGMIVPFEGAIVNIPSGWTLCDGTNGTPDLQDKFIVGAGDTYNPGITGGAINHNHLFTGDGHTHVVEFGDDINAGTDLEFVTDSETTVGLSDSESSLPPYYSLAYIMKL